MSFEEIYIGHYSKVFRLCMGYVNDADWAKDLAQETFINVWQKLHQFRNESAIGTDATFRNARTTGRHKRAGYGE